MSASPSLLSYHCFPITASSSIRIWIFPRKTFRDCSILSWVRSTYHHRCSLLRDSQWFAEEGNPTLSIHSSIHPASHSFIHSFILHSFLVHLASVYCVPYTVLNTRHPRTHALHTLALNVDIPVDLEGLKRRKKVRMMAYAQNDRKGTTSCREQSLWENHIHTKEQIRIQSSGR